MNEAVCYVEMRCTTMLDIIAPPLWRHSTSQLLNWPAEANLPRDVQHETDVIFPKRRVSQRQQQFTDHCSTRFHIHPSTRRRSRRYSIVSAYCKDTDETSIDDVSVRRRGLLPGIPLEHTPACFGRLSSGSHSTWRTVSTLSAIITLHTAD